MTVRELKEAFIGVNETYEVIFVDYDTSEPTHHIISKAMLCYQDKDGDLHESDIKTVAKNGGGCIVLAG